MGQAGKLSITLTPELLEAVQQKVAQGRFKTTSEVMRAALRLWLDEEAEHEARLAAIRAKIQRAIDDPRPSIPIEEMFERQERKLREKFSRRAAE